MKSIQHEQNSNENLALLMITQALLPFCQLKSKKGRMKLVFPKLINKILDITIAPVELNSFEKILKIVEKYEKKAKVCSSIFSDLKLILKIFIEQMNVAELVANLENTFEQIHLFEMNSEALPKINRVRTSYQEPVDLMNWCIKINYLALIKLLLEEYSGNEHPHDRIQNIRSLCLTNAGLKKGEILRAAVILMVLDDTSLDDKTIREILSVSVEQNNLEYFKILKSHSRLSSFFWEASFFEGISKKENTAFFTALMEGEHVIAPLAITLSGSPSFLAEIFPLLCKDWRFQCTIHAFTFTEFCKKSRKGDCNTVELFQLMRLHEHCGQVPLDWEVRSIRIIPLLDLILKAGTPTMLQWMLAWDKKNHYKLLPLEGFILNTGGCYDPTLLWMLAVHHSTPNALLSQIMKAIFAYAKPKEIKQFMKASLAGPQYLNFSNTPLANQIFIAENVLAHFNHLKTVEQAPQRLFAPSVIAVKNESHEEDSLTTERYSN